MSHPLTAVLTVSLIMIKEERVLVLREQKKGGLKYNLPGGHIESGEGVLGAAAREAVEETGFSIRLGGLVQLLVRTWEDGHHSVRQTYLAEILEGELKTEEGSEACWMTREEVEGIPEERWNFGTRQAVFLGLEGRTVDPQHVVWKE